MENRLLLGLQLDFEDVCPSLSVPLPRKPVPLRTGEDRDGSDLLKPYLLQWFHEVTLKNTYIFFETELYIWFP